MRLFIEAVGLKEAEAKFSNLAYRAGNARPAMLTVAGIMMESIAKQFESGGRRGGGSWRPLTAEWLARKVREGLDPRIGFAHHRLFNAYTAPASPDQRLTVTNRNVRLSSSVPYAATQQHHRPFVKFTAGDHVLMAKTVADFLTGSFRVQA